MYAEDIIPVPDEQSLPSELVSRLGTLGIDKNNVSLLVYSDQRATPLVVWRADEVRNPASVMKMVTTFAALSDLGPGYRWETEIRHTGSIKNGVLTGDLILIGRGDPMLVNHDLWNLVNHLHSRGIHTINGDLIIDTTLFDLEEHDPHAFDGEGYRPYNAGADAALFNFSSVDFQLVPESGDKFVNILVVPEVHGLKIDSQVTQLSGACRGQHIKLRMKVIEEADQRVVRFTGNYPRKCGRYELTRSIMPSTELLYGTLVTLLEQRGGSLTGGLLLGKAPKKSKKLLALNSRTLAEIIRSTNKYSNNVMSRQLLLTLGAEKAGAATTVNQAVSAALQTLKVHGIDTEGLKMANGSGLCRDCQVTARSLMQLLDAAWSSQYMPEFIASLGVPGVDGSLKRRFPKGSYKGRVHMKTGTIDHVVAAAGYAQSTSDQRLRFVLLINQDNIHKGKGQRFQRKLMSWLMEQ